MTLASCQSDVYRLRLQQRRNLLGSRETKDLDDPPVLVIDEEMRKVEGK
jgi:hypothetical protein